MNNLILTVRNNSFSSLTKRQDPVPRTSLVDVKSVMCTVASVIKKMSIETTNEKTVIVNFVFRPYHEIHEHRENQKDDSEQYEGHFDFRVGRVSQNCNLKK